MKSVIEPTADERREYLFEMLSQLARMADDCGENGIALVLQTIVASRNGSSPSVIDDKYLACAKASK